MKIIQSHEISVIIQGNYFKYCSSSSIATSRVIEAWRKLLPDSQIILSTWQSPPESPLSIDKLVVALDPGVTLTGRKTDPKTVDNNIGRQIRSTQSGLSVAEKTYAIKTRTDIMPTGTGFISLFMEARKRNPKYCILERPIVTCRFCSLDPEKSGTYLHISDIFHFGTTADLMTFWNIDIPIIPVGTKYSYLDENKRRLLTIDETMLRPEQYLTLQLFRKSNANFNLNYPKDTNSLVVSQSEAYVFNNFTIRDHHEVGIELPARMVKSAQKGNKIYATDKIHGNEALFTDAAYETNTRPSGDNGDLAGHYWQKFRATPYNLGVSNLISGIAMILQHPNLIWNKEKMKRWRNYRREGMLFLQEARKKSRA
jgi:hypothetical protein